MFQKIASVIKILFILLIILLVSTILLTIYSGYLKREVLNTFGENKGVYIFDVE